MKMYRAWLNNRIDEYEITKKTDKSIWYKVTPNDKPRAERIITDTHAWFSSKEEAKAYLIEEAKKRVIKSKNDLKYFMDQLEQVKRI